jgi:hypothetical protein
MTLIKLNNYKNLSRYLQRVKKYISKLIKEYCMKPFITYKSMLLLLVLASLLLAGCATQSIKEIKSPDYVGKDVMIAGTVESTIKLGGLSGFTLTDKNGDSIGVKSDSLPKEGSTITVRGILIKDTILGYYIQNKD